MYCIPLFELKELNDTQRKSIDDFFGKFLSNGYVTVSKAVEYTGMQDKIIVDTFSKLYLCGYLDIIYAVKCPECGMLIKKIDDLEYFSYENSNYCYACDQPIEVSNDDIVALFVKKENGPFVNGQHPGNALIKKQSGDVAQSDGVEYLRAMSENFANIVDMYTCRFSAERAKSEEMQEIKERAYIRYRKNKKTYNIASICFRVFSFIILSFVIWFAGLEKNISGFVTIIIYVFQNVIDVILKSAIITDLNEIERDEMFLASKSH